MAYRVSTYLTLKGIRQFVDLSDFSYGEWIIDNNRSPAYHINAFDKFNSEKSIGDLIEKENSIDLLLKKINKNNKVNLSLHGKPWGILIKSEITNIQLDSLPISWLESIN